MDGCTNLVLDYCIVSSLAAFWVGRVHRSTAEIENANTISTLSQTAMQPTSIYTYIYIYTGMRNKETAKRNQLVQPAVSALNTSYFGTSGCISLGREHNGCIANTMAVSTLAWIQYGCVSSCNHEPTKHECCKWLCQPTMYASDRSVYIACVNPTALTQ